MGIYIYRMINEVDDNNIDTENDNVSIEIKDISKNKHLSINGLLCFIYDYE